MPKIKEADTEARIEDTYRLLAKGHRPSQITEAIARKYGCSKLTALDEYLPRAQEMMVEEASTPKEVLRAKGLAFYSSVIDDTATATRDKINAQARIDRLLGLEIPNRDGRTETKRQLVESGAESEPDDSTPAGKFRKYKIVG